MRATDLMSLRSRYEIIYRWDVIGEVFVLSDRHILVEQQPLRGILVRRGRRGA